MSAAPSAGPIGVVRFAARPLDPIVVQFIDATIELLVAERETLRTKQGITREVWAVAGAYVLVGSATAADKRVRARPGLARGDLIDRMNDHLGDPAMAWFSRAVLIRDTRQGFNSAQAAYLEGRLHDIVEAAPLVEHDFGVNRDVSLQPHETAEIERRYLPHVLAVLELIGVPTAIAAPATLTEPEIELRPPEEAPARD